MSETKVRKKEWKKENIDLRRCRSTSQQKRCESGVFDFFWAKAIASHGQTCHEKIWWSESLRGVCVVWKKGVREKGDGWRCRVEVWPTYPGRNFKTFSRRKKIFLRKKKQNFLKNILRWSKTFLRQDIPKMFLEISWTSRGYLDCCKTISRQKKHFPWRFGKCLQNVLKTSCWVLFTIFLLPLFLVRLGMIPLHFHLR